MHPPRGALHPARSRAASLPLVPGLLCVALFIAGAAVAVSFTSDLPGATSLLAARALAREIWIPLLWFASALGVGRWVCRLPGLRDASAALVGATGVACLLLIDQCAGSLGAFAHPSGAWIILVPGLAALVDALARPGPRSAVLARAGELVRHGWMFAPAVSILVLAALSSPGFAFLWRTEFGAYDALSYHLALPRDWLQGGRLAPVDWNAYSFLPSWIEGAYLHLFALGGDPALLGLRAQLFHALLACLAALVVGDAAAALVSESSAAPARAPLARSARILACAFFLGTPWVIVTGSMAYNEMGAALACAALIAGWRTVGAPAARGLLAGLFVALAVGSKLSAGVLVVPPVALLLLVTEWRARARGAIGSGFESGVQSRLAHPELAGPAALLAGRPVASALTSAAIAVIVALLALAPWLVRNALDTGNPLFPFAAWLFGHGGWSEAQLDTWNRAHGAAGGVAERLEALWIQILRFGLGPAPVGDEPWRPYWLVLPWAGVIGAVLLAARRETRRLGAALLGALLLFVVLWLLFTHMKSRFGVPAAPIAAIGAGVALARLLAPRGALVMALAFLLALQPLVVFATEGPHAALAIDGEREMTGDDIADAIAESMAAGTRWTPPAELRSRAFVVNHELAAQAKRSGRAILLIGDAATYRYRAPIRSSTVWTRDPLVRKVLAAAEGAEGRSELLALLDEAKIGWVLVDPRMLSVWERSRWLDPAMTPASVARLTARLEPSARLEDGAVIFRVPSRGPAAPGVLR